MTLTKAIKLLKSPDMTSRDLEETIEFLEQLREDLRTVRDDQKGYISGKCDISNENFEATINQINELL